MDLLASIIEDILTKHLPGDLTVVLGHNKKRFIEHIIAEIIYKSNEQGIIIGTEATGKPRVGNAKRRAATRVPSESVESQGYAPRSLQEAAGLLDP